MNKPLLKTLFSLGFFIVFFIIAILAIFLLIFVFGPAVIRIGKYIALILVGILYRPLFNIAKKTVAVRFGLSEADFVKKVTDPELYPQKGRDVPYRKWGSATGNPKRSNLHRY